MITKFTSTYATEGSPSDPEFHEEEKHITDRLICFYADTWVYLEGTRLEFENSYGLRYFLFTTGAVTIDYNETGKP